MGLGFYTWKDIFQVLIVPLSAALIAVLWQAISAWRRRRNFEKLIRQEITEAAPNRTDDLAEAGLSKPWHAYLNRRFLHEDLIANPVANAEFILSLNPALSYNLSQMWISFKKARKTPTEDPLAQAHAAQFCWHLGRTAAYLDRKGRGNLIGTVWLQWVETVEAQYPQLKLDLKVDDLPGWSTGKRHARRHLVAANQQHRQNCRRGQAEALDTGVDPKLHLLQ